MYPGFLTKSSAMLYQDICNELIHQLGLQNDMFSRKVLSMFIAKSKYTVYEFISFTETELKRFSGIGDVTVIDVIELQNKIKLHYKL